MSVRQLKEVLTRNFVSYSGCCEKWELVEKVSRLYKENEENQKSCRCPLLALLPSGRLFSRHCVAFSEDEACSQRRGPVGSLCGIAWGGGALVRLPALESVSVWVGCLLESRLESSLGQNALQMPRLSPRPWELAQSSG